jgi:hypothetical protein
MPQCWWYWCHWKETVYVSLLCKQCRDSDNGFFVYTHSQELILVMIRRVVRKTPNGSCGNIRSATTHDVTATTLRQRRYGNDVTATTFRQRRFDSDVLTTTFRQRRFDNDVSTTTFRQRRFNNDVSTTTFRQRRFDNDVSSTTFRQRRFDNTELRLRSHSIKLRRYVGYDEQWEGQKKLSTLFFTDIFLFCCCWYWWWMLV